MLPTILRKAFTFASIAPMLASSLVLTPRDETAPDDGNNSSSTNVTKIQTQFKSLVGWSNETCENIAETPGKLAWSTINANPALDQFIKMYQENRLYCEACFGLTVDECRSAGIYVTGCGEGLRDAAQRIEGSHPRWDIALGLYSHSSGFKCGEQGDSSCGEAATCETVKGSAVGLVMVKSMVNLSRFLVRAKNEVNDARLTVQGFSSKFSEVFAPLPDPATARYLTGSLTAAAIGILSLFGPLGAVAGGIGVNVFAAGAGALLAGEIPLPADTDNLLSELGQQASSMLNDMTESLFTNGSYFKDKPQTVTDLMRDGQLLNLTIADIDNGKTRNATLRVIYQQAAAVTWQSLQIEDKGKTPVIVFAPGQCSKLNYKDGGSVPFPNVGLENLDAGIDYKDSCYWLISLEPKWENAVNKWLCTKVSTMPGATHKALQDIRNDTGGLMLEDFIIPSVEGWLKNDRINGFPLTSVASMNSGVIPNPQSAGAMNISVCDYRFDAQVQPGGGCPIWQGEISPTNDADKVGECPVHLGNNDPPNSLIEYPDGTWQSGTCKVAWTWFDSAIPVGDGLNPITTGYQLAVDLHDNNDRVVGNAAKTYVRGTWEVTNSALPYNMYVHLPAVEHDNEQVEFWYGSDHWTGDDANHKCDSGKWVNGAKKGYCFFPCFPAKDGDAKEDPWTKTPPIYMPLQQTIPFGPTTRHNFEHIRQQPAQPVRNFNADPYDGEDTCWVRVTQYWYQVNKVAPYQYEAYWGTDKLGFLTPDFNAQVPAPADVPQPIYGTRGSFNVTFPANGWDHMLFDFQDGNGVHWHWDTDNHKEYGCSYEINWDWRCMRQAFCKFHCQHTGDPVDS